jgi:hypothetical protein
MFHRIARTTTRKINTITSIGSFDLNQSQPCSAKAGPVEGQPAVPSPINKITPEPEVGLGAGGEAFVGPVGGFGFAPVLGGAAVADGAVTGVAVAVIFRDEVIFCSCFGLNVIAMAQDAEGLRSQPVGRTEKSPLDGVSRVISTETPPWAVKITVRTPLVVPVICLPKSSVGGTSVKTKILCKP